MNTQQNTDGTLLKSTALFAFLNEQRTKQRAKTEPTPTLAAVAPTTTCSACGMLVGLHRNYHPHAACLMFRGCHNGNTVEANLRAVIEYGMKAQAAGVTLEKAMDDISCRKSLPNAESIHPESKP